MHEPRQNVYLLFYGGFGVPKKLISFHERLFKNTVFRSKFFKHFFCSHFHSLISIYMYLIWYQVITDMDKLSESGDIHRNVQETIIEGRKLGLNIRQLSEQLKIQISAIIQHQSQASPKNMENQ